MSEVNWTGRTGPFTFRVNPGVFAPTHTSKTIAEALEVGPGDTVIDVGCGSGVLSFVAARLGAHHVVGCDISEEAVEMARLNARALGLEERCEFRVGSLLDPVRDLRADVLIGDVSGSPTRSRRSPAGSPTGGPGDRREPSSPPRCWSRSGRR